MERVQLPQADERGMSLPFVWLDVRQVMAACPFKTRGTLYKRIRDGEWPKAYKFGSRSLWRSDEIAFANAELANKAAQERDTHASRSKARSQTANAARWGGNSER